MKSLFYICKVQIAQSLYIKNFKRISKGHSKDKRQLNTYIYIKDRSI